MDFNEKIQHLADVLAKETLENMRASAARGYNNDPEKLAAWDKHIGAGVGAAVIPGPKYTKVDVKLPQQSGRYMVVNETGEIFSIKAYGVIHRGHQFGTLDTVDSYYWGEYRAIKKRNA